MDGQEGQIWRAEQGQRDVTRGARPALRTHRQVHLKPSARALPHSRCPKGDSTVMPCYPDEDTKAPGAGAGTCCGQIAGKWPRPGPSPPPPRCAWRGRGSAPRPCGRARGQRGAGPICLEQGRGAVGGASGPRGRGSAVVEPQALDDLLAAQRARAQGLAALVAAADVAAVEEDHLGLLFQAHDTF